MKANELRIWNYLQDQNGNFLLVIHISTESIQTTVLDRSKYPLPNGWQMQPIPITPEILEKCGFELYDNYTDESLGDFIFESYRKWKSKYIYIAIHNRQEGGYDCGLSRQLTDLVPVDEIDANSFNVCELIYLHQLQNIYFAITGEELEVKL